MFHEVCERSVGKPLGLKPMHVDCERTFGDALRALVCSVSGVLLKNSTFSQEHRTPDECMRVVMSYLIPETFEPLKPFRWLQGRQHLVAEDCPCLQTALFIPRVKQSTYLRVAEVSNHKQKALANAVA